MLGNDILNEDLKTCAEVEKKGIIKKCNELILNQFRVGLKRELMKSVGPVLMRESKLTIDKAEELAKQEELNELMLRSRFQSNVNAIKSTLKCHGCGKFGHFVKDCRSHIFNRNSVTSQQQRDNYHNNHPSTSRSNNYGQNQQNSNITHNTTLNRGHQPPHYNSNQSGNVRANKFNSNITQQKPNQNHNNTGNFRPRNFNAQYSPQCSYLYPNQGNSLNPICPPFTPRTGGNTQ